MAKKEYAFYPGCSSQLKASASNYLVSVNAMCAKLDVGLAEIPDWNCCGASIGYCEGSELPRLAIKRKPPSIFEYEFEDFQLLNYQAHPSIKAPIAV